MFTGKTSHVGGEKEQKEHKLSDDSAEGLKKKFHNFKVRDADVVAPQCIEQEQVYDHSSDESRLAQLI